MVEHRSNGRGEGRLENVTVSPPAVKGGLELRDI